VKSIFYFVFLLFAIKLTAQTPATDTAVVPQKPAADTVKKPRPKPIKRDSSVLLRLRPDTAITKRDTVPAEQDKLPFAASKRSLLYREVLAINPYYNFFGKPENLLAEERIPASKDAMFYILTGLLLFFALIKILFNKYMSNLLGLVFRGSLRQKQIREQLLQTPLPSLFMNIFFVMVAGLYVFFLLQHYQTAPGTGFWFLLLYCVLAVALVYLVKFLILKFTGWIFNMRDAADTYIFIVFLVNKLLAIFLLPLLIVMTFSLSSWTDILLTLSFIMVGGFFAYRYMVSFAPVRREVKVSQFHFFMYLCAFEIIPLLLIYKVLLRFF